MQKHLNLLTKKENDTYLHVLEELVVDLWKRFLSILCLFGGENDNLYKRTFHVYLHTDTQKQITCLFNMQTHI